MSLPLARFAAGGVLAATHSPSSPAPVPGPVLSVARYCFRNPQPANSQPAELCCLILGACQAPGSSVRAETRLPNPALLLFNSQGRRGCSLTHPGWPRRAGPANISPLPIEPPATPRTIRGDGRVLLPRAVPAARNITGRRPASADGPRRVRRVGTGQTPPVCRRQQEGHPAAADHTPRTDPLTNTCPSAPPRPGRWAARSQ